jgi:hypothetical protein
MIEKSYRELLILLGEDVTLPKKGQIFVHGLGREVFMTCFKRIIPAISCND